MCEEWLCECLNFIKILWKQAKRTQMICFQNAEQNMNNIGIIINKNRNITLFDIKYDNHNNYSFMITLLTSNKIEVNTSI